MVLLLNQVIILHTHIHVYVHAEDKFYLWTGIVKCITILNLLHTTQKVNKEGLPLIIIPVYVHLIFTYNYLLSSIGPQSTATSHR